MNVRLETKLVGAFAVLGWLIEALASTSMALGNPTEINAVVGAGIPTAVFTATTVALVISDARHTSDGV